MLVISSFLSWDTYYDKFIEIDAYLKEHYKYYNNSKKALKIKEEFQKINNMFELDLPQDKPLSPFFFFKKLYDSPVYFSYLILGLCDIDKEIIINARKKAENKKFIAIYY